MDMNKKIEILIMARYPVIWIFSHEESRALEALSGIARRQKCPLLVWSITQGLRNWEIPEQEAEGQSPDYLGISRHILDYKGDGLFVLLDYHRYMQDPVVVRGLRDLATELPNQSHFKSAIILAPDMVIPTELEKQITVVDYPLPGQDDLAGLLDRIIATRSEQEIPVRLPNEDRDRLIQALRGLTLVEAENVLAQAVSATGSLSAEAIPFILEEKKGIVRKSGALEYFEPRVTMDDVGGLDLLKAWISERAVAFSEKARQFGLPYPRGLLLTGTPGGGKSLTVKAMAASWKVPLLRLDMSRIFKGIVGGTEAAIRDALKLSDALGRCVLWLDEVEKGLSGLGSTNVSDAGTTGRMFGALLTWMEEHTTPVFVAATSNVGQLSVLPPEFIERFDEVFTIEPPGAEARAEILAIHLRDRGRNPEDFDLARLAEATEGMVGRQLRNLIWAALYRAFGQEKDLDTRLILDALQEKRRGVKEIKGIRARPASSPERRERESTRNIRVGK
ncbi:MAG: AAA family ATPase [Chloroflexota bacterium]|nr:AAA family ATPase [Chloroflexota bacterium]